MAIKRSSTSSSGGFSSSGSSSSSGVIDVGVIIIMVLFIGFAAGHVYRHTQTKTKHHLTIAGGAFIGIISFALMIAGGKLLDPLLITSGFPVFVLSSGILKVTSAFLLAKWSRSMVKVFADTSRQSFQIGVACMGLFGLGTLIVILGWALGLGGVVYTTYEFLRGGYGLTLVANIILGVTATWLYTQTPNNGAPGLDTKRKQLLVLLGMSISMFCSDLGGVLLSFYVEFAFILFFLSFGLYPIHALTGFENEPDFASGVPIIAPGVVYVQQPMSVPGQPGVVYTQPAAMDQSGVVYNQPGVAYSQPGVVYNQPSVAYSQPGVAYSQPGVVYSQPGVMYSQPGVAYPPGAINHRGDESMASNINPPVSYAGVPVTGMPEPVVTPNVMENIPISNMPPQPPAATSVPLPPSTTPYPQ